MLCPEFPLGTVGDCPIAFACAPFPGAVCAFELLLLCGLFLSSLFLNSLFLSSCLALRSLLVLCYTCACLAANAAVFLRVLEPSSQSPLLACSSCSICAPP